MLCALFFACALFVLSEAKPHHHSTEASPTTSGFGGGVVGGAVGGGFAFGGGFSGTSSLNKMVALSRSASCNGRRGRGSTTAAPTTAATTTEGP